MEIINRDNKDEIISQLQAELEKYKAMESEGKALFKELKEKLGIEFSTDMDFGDLLSILSGVGRKLMFSSKKQAELAETIGKAKTLINYFTKENGN